MKIKDLAAAIAAAGGPVDVYWYGRNGKYDFDRQRENPEECRWGTDGRLYGRYYASGNYRPVEPGTKLRATHVRLRRVEREWPADTPRHVRTAYDTDMYAPLAQVVGLYDEVAGQRREMVAATRAALDATRRAEQVREMRLNQVLDRAAVLGHPLGDVRLSREGVTVGGVSFDVLEALVNDLVVKTAALDALDGRGLVVEDTDPA
ncbi:MAG TPA: hypothetical protein VF516_35010 [Kofleriaceae bacterium]